MNKTTLQVNMDTLERLRNLKQFERQSYDEILNVLVDNYECDDEPLTEQEIKEIKIGLEQIHKGETVPFEKVLKERGITLD